MNKYEEAYDFILDATNGGEGMVKELISIRELVDNYSRLEKALYKAIDLLIEADLTCCDVTDDNGNCDYNHCPTCWKNYLMNEVKEDENSEDLTCCVNGLINKGGEKV